jgi:dipeptidyl-peptidase-4
MMKKIYLILLCIPQFLLAQKKITLEDIYKKGTFRSEFAQGFTSMNDGRFYRETIAGGIIKKAFEDGATVDTLIKAKDPINEKKEKLSLFDVEWSKDEKKLLIFIDREYIYRRSSKAIVYVYDIATKKVTKVDTSKILHASFSPDATKVAFVKNNNLYVKNLLTNKTVAVTNDGKNNEIINGNCDWVYEEEFSFTQAFDWSANGNFVAFYRFNESKVKEFSFDEFDGLYPTQNKFKYPKVGEANSEVDIYIYNVATGKKVKANIGTEKDIYIPRIKFTTKDDKLSICWLNRLQNEMKLLMVDAASGKSNVYYQEKNKYYVEAETADVTFLQDGKHFIMLSEKEGFNQLYKISFDGNTSVKLTKDNVDVTGVLGVDEKNGFVYFTNCQWGALDRAFCKVDFNGIQQQIISQSQGTNNVISLNSDFTYALNSFSTINTPTTFFTTHLPTGKTKMLKENKKLNATIVDYGFEKASFIKVPTSKGETLNGWMLMPKNYDQTKKYPVLFCNYGGPGSQQVANRWGAVNAWHQYLSQEGYVVVSIDNTGTGFRGEEFKKKTYLQLGNLEIEDQIDAAKYLATLPFVDATRIGHWGWSFGGFMSSLAITKGADVFKTAIAVAPVTNWMYYDNIYTERFMRTPKENKKGYEQTAPINFVNKIKGKFLIIHGTADDNVHFQNSVMMVDEMIKKNVEFESAYYPNKNHGINGGNTTFHLYTKMTKFIKENL